MKDKKVTVYGHFWKKDEVVIVFTGAKKKVPTIVAYMVQVNE